MVAHSRSGRSKQVRRTEGCRGRREEREEGRRSCPPGLEPSPQEVKGGKRPRNAPGHKTFPKRNIPNPASGKEEKRSRSTIWAGKRPYHPTKLVKKRITVNAEKTGNDSSNAGTGESSGTALARNA